MSALVSSCWIRHSFRFRVSLCSHGWPGTYCVGQADLSTEVHLSPPSESGFKDVLHHRGTELTLETKSPHFRLADSGVDPWTQLWNLTLYHFVLWHPGDGDLLTFTVHRCFLIKGALLRSPPYRFISRTYSSDFIQWIIILLSFWFCCLNSSTLGDFFLLKNMRYLRPTRVVDSCEAWLFLQGFDCLYYEMQPQPADKHTWSSSLLWALHRHTHPDSVLVLPVHGLCP